MRRRTLWFTLLAALLLPTAAAAGTASGPTVLGTGLDGSLSIRKGDGALTMSIRGAVIGRLRVGALDVEVDADDSCDDLGVWGAEDETEDVRLRDAGEFVRVCRFSGRKLRFRLVGVQLVIRVRRARDLDLSAVGRGFAILRGAGGATDGTYSVNGDDYVSLPDDGDLFLLAARPAE